MPALIKGNQVKRAPKETRVGYCTELKERGRWRMVELFRRFKDAKADVAWTGTTIRKRMRITKWKRVGVVATKIEAAYK